MATFLNRDEEIRQIIEAEPGVLWNVYGEAGIGKTRLCQEIAGRIQDEYASALIMTVDFQPLSVREVDRIGGVLRQLVDQAEGRLEGHWRSNEETSAQIVGQLGRMAERMRVVLIGDTTEAIQEDMTFWEWLEGHLVGPLVTETRVQLIFAGRVPAPWRRPEVRRALRLCRLDPLPQEDASRALVQEVLEENGYLGAGESLDRAVDLVLSFSFGHPLLSEKLAAYVASHWPSEQAPSVLKSELCEKIVRPFIEDYLFQGVEAPWKEMMWWISALDWFDAAILQRYFARVNPGLVEGKPDYFFVQGITRLRIHNTVVWREERGDRLHGVILDIVRHCFQVQKPAVYSRACRAAADMFEALAGEFADTEAEKYLREADMYRRRAKEEVSS